MSTFTTTATTTTPAYEIKVRIKSLLESRRDRAEETTALAIFNTFRSAAAHYYTFGSGREYVIELSEWSEEFRPGIEQCMNYLIAFNEQYWQDSYEELYAPITEIMRQHLVASRLRKLALLRAA